MFVYLPLPAYKERYTEYLSVHDGIFERGLKFYNIDFKAFRRDFYVHEIGVGQVLDPRVMCEWGFFQTEMVVEAICSGLIKAGDIIYFEDFWHPGMEMIAYTLSLKGLFGKVKLAAFCHAQSVDPNDFTAKLMLPWIRGFEESWFTCLDHIFVAANSLKKMWIDEVFIASQNKAKISVIGTIFDSEYLIKEIGTMLCEPKVRGKNVIYSSRLDSEKRPHLFLDIAESVLEQDPDIMFTIASSFRQLRSNDATVLPRIELLKQKHRSKFFICTGLSKKEYFTMLASSAVQINTALQDFVSYTLLEATAFGCAPFYPSSNDSFVDAIGVSAKLLYNDYYAPSTLGYKLRRLVWHSSKRQVHSAAGGDGSSDNDFIFVHDKYNKSLARLLGVLGLIETARPLDGYRSHTDYASRLWDKRNAFSITKVAI